MTSYFCLVTLSFLPVYKVLDMSQSQGLICHRKENFHLSKFIFSLLREPRSTSPLPAPVREQKEWAHETNWLVAISF